MVFHDKINGTLKDKMIRQKDHHQRAPNPALNVSIWSKMEQSVLQNINESNQFKHNKFIFKKPIVLND